MAIKYHQATKLIEGQAERGATILSILDEEHTGF